MARQKPQPRLLSVTKSERLTPNMHRLTLGGPNLADFPQGQSGGYIKFMLPNPNAEKNFVRTYTVRNESELGIEVDFALHGDGDAGPATNWALNAKIGDEVLVGGPGPDKPLPETDGPFLLVGDMTALPAISVNLENLFDSAKAHAIILIRDAADKQSLNVPEGVTLDWIVEADLGTNSALLADAARALPNIDEVTYAWVACEFEAMKQLRQFLRTEKGLSKEQLYISSYWKRGLIEDEHKQVKRVDAEALVS